MSSQFNQVLASCSEQFSTAESNFGWQPESGFSGNCVLTKVGKREGTTKPENGSLPYISYSPRFQVMDGPLAGREFSIDLFFSAKKSDNPTPAMRDCKAFVSCLSGDSVTDLGKAFAILDAHADGGAVINLSVKDNVSKGKTYKNFTFHSRVDQAPTA